MGARIPIIHKVYVKSRDLSRVFRKKSADFIITVTTIQIVGIIHELSLRYYVKFSVFIPLSLFLLNPIFQAIFFSLILAQQPYIYGRTDSHYT
jgi:hypothetical protein